MAKDDDYSQFVAARWNRLVRTAVLLGCTRESAEDLVQEALVKCYVHWSKVDAADDRDAYVHRLLVNTHRTRLRRRWTGEQATADLPDVRLADPTEEFDVAHTVLAALDRLTREHRAVVVLRHYAGLDETQTAAVLGVPRGTVKSRHSRAVARLAADPTLVALKETQ